MSPGISVLWTLLQVVTGLGIGTLLGLCGWFINFIKHEKLRMWMKFLFCACSAVGIVLGS
jgi:hypothetical protein